MKSSLQQINQWLLDLVLPKQCLGCQKTGTYFCCACLEKIPINTRFICPSCNQPLVGLTKHKKCQSNLDGLLVVGQWQNFLLKEAIHNLKYDFIKDLAKPLGQLMVKALKQNKSLSGNAKFLLIPIPLHSHRLHWRGFNQSEILSQQISQEFNWPMTTNLLLKRKPSRAQMTIDNIQNRLSNIKGVFTANTQLKNSFGNLSKWTIFLVDDVCTTGATLEEAGLCLKQALNPLKIYGLVLARA